jgi:predicted nucleic acid-binding protein
MNAKAFLDTNIILYAEFDDKSEKHQRASDLLLKDLVGSEVFMSTQIFNEFYVQALRKGKTHDEIISVLCQYSEKFTVNPVTLATVEDAWRIKERYQLSYWDSLVISAAREAGCGAIYSEDLQDGMVIDGVQKNKIEKVSSG